MTGDSTAGTLAHRDTQRATARIEEALRRDLGLELLDRLWARNDLAEDEALTLAVEAQHATRRRMR